ncbi:MAG: metallophosphoesterase [Euryarchaeota archaeon]|nr:metallophosphoesterase [Euryarchaeota archaeon]
MNRTKILVLNMMIALCILTFSAQAYTTEVHVARYAADGETILNETAVNYTWMEANLPVQGDGVTHYYHQGPVFEDAWEQTYNKTFTGDWNSSEEKWDLVDWGSGYVQEEQCNCYPAKDYGACKGTNVSDLCDLVGGMSPGETVKIKANDGFSKTFKYKNVYNSDSRQGSPVVTWYRADEGYVSEGYGDGMCLVFFADTTVNPWGRHIFGIGDMCACFDEEDYHYFVNYPTFYPATTGYAVKKISDIEIYSDEVAPDVIFDDSVTLTEGDFTLTAYNSGENYSVKQLTPLGALDAASRIGGFDYNVTDKKFNSIGILMIDDIGDYKYNKVNSSVKWAWSCAVNDYVLDDWDNPETEGLNIYKLHDGDVVYYFYGNVKLPDYGPEDATAAVRITVDAGTCVDIIFDGSVTLEEGNFTWVDKNGNLHEVSNFTPHGALEAASIAGGFGYNGSWKGSKKTALIDWIEEYGYNNSVTPKLTWNYQLNGVYQNYFSDTTGISNNPITDGDYIEFYYGPAQETTENATAVVRITVNPEPGDWNLDLSGALDETIAKAEFEDEVACGHYANWTDPETGAFWEGIPLWHLVGRIDDDIQHGSGAFNDTLAAEGYSVKVIAGDGWSTSLDSADIARNDGYIVANKLNGSELPVNTSSGKPCWPLHLKGANVTGGQQVGNIAKIELVGLPEPPEGWELKLLGDVGDVITQAEFEDAVSCHGATYTDGGDIWAGVPLWHLVGAVDDLETTSHWTFNDTLAATNYTVKVIAADDYNRTFDSGKIAYGNGYIVANTLNGEPLDYLCPLKLVGSEVFGGNRVGNISEIDLVELITPPPDPDSYNLNLTGRITDVLSQAEYEAAANSSCYGVTWTDPDTGDVWEGVPLWFFCGWVDDRIPHGPDGFNDNQAAAGYKIIVKAGDGYSKEFASADVARNGGYIVADMLNCEPLSKEGSHPPWPLRLVGSEVSGGARVGNIVEIELVEFGEPQELPSIHVIMYDAYGTTILNETNVTYQWMEENLQVIGDGTTAYRFEGVDFTEGDHWDQNGTYPGGFKIDRVVKGTSVKDLCELIGGMAEGTEIRFVASDGYETKLGHENIYTDTLTAEQRERQGEAFLAWWTDDQGYVPDYSSGMRLFFTANDSDHIFGLWDMHECMDEKYWHYYWSEGIRYPSCAGLSAKYIDTIKIYNGTEADWNLTLDGAITDTISKSYFEQALACTMGDHAAEYTDEEGRTWEGLPLWLLCGWVDDSNQHSEGAYNDALAAAGYNIAVIGSDGYSVTIDSRDTIRNSNYIVANTLNGTHIHEDSSNWPLRLVGANISVSMTVKRIVVYSNKTMLPGDANHDGRLSSVDAILALRMAVCEINTDLVADMNQDGRITSLDALMIMQAIHNPSPSPTLLWGPYITGTTTNSTMINWKTENATNGTLKYATEEYYTTYGDYDHILTDTSEMQLHNLVITNLTPDAVYHYQITIGNKPTSDCTFRTFPADGSFTFIVYGDTREQTGSFTQMERHKLVSDRIAEENNVSFVIHTGDFVCNGNDLDEWNDFFNAGRAMLANTTIYPVLGNHEYNHTNYYDAFGVPEWYSFDCGNAHFTILDSNEADRTEQTEWLQNDIDSNATWKLLSFHHPPYSSAKNRDGGWINLRDYWENIFINNSVDAVFNGHVHAYERYKENGIQYMVLGCGGAPLYSLAEEKISGYQNSFEHTLGYARITMDGDTATVDVIKVADISTVDGNVTLYLPNTIFETVVLS